MVSGDSLVAWLLIAVIVAYFLYKEWPEFRKRVSAKAVQDQKEEASDKTVEERLERIEADVNEIKLKLNRDYDRINDLVIKQKRYQKMVEDSLEEREIIMEALLGALGGLQELGANGPTREAESKIRTYLNKQAHRNEEGEI
jgi:hypothetical protein